MEEKQPTKPATRADFVAIVQIGSSKYIRITPDVEEKFGAVYQGEYLKLETEKGKITVTKAK